MFQIIELPKKKYQVIYADPPWKTSYAKELKNNVSGTKSMDTKLPYQTMTDKEIMALPIAELTDNDAILFLWLIDSRIPIVKELMNGWGFEYITVGFVWHKKATTTSGENASLTPYTRKSTEFCFIGRKGGCLVKNHSCPQFINEAKREHSRKPDIVRTYITKMCGDLPRIELFARQKVQGWDTWGNEVPKETQMLLQSNDESHPTPPQGVADARGMTEDDG